MSLPIAVKHYETNPCACGHDISTHNNADNCSVCTCREFEEAEQEPMCEMCGKHPSVTEYYEDTFHYYCPTYDRHFETGEIEVLEQMADDAESMQQEQLDKQLGVS